MKFLRLSRPAGQLNNAVCALVAAASLSNSAPALRAQTATPAHAATEETIPLERFVVSATRTPQAIDTIPSSLTALEISSLAQSQVPSLADALGQVPGLIIVNSGGAGAQSSIFMRGASSHQTLLVVDGVRMNDRSASYFNFLGGADLTGLGRVEILRGPQSTLYGSAAMGGVILLETTRGCGKLQGSLSAAAGTLDTYGAALSLSGGNRSIGYSASFARSQTDNDRPLNAYDQWTYSTRLEWQAAEAVLLGFTLRGQQGNYEEPGSTLFPGAGEIDTNNHLVTTYAQWSPSTELRSRLTLGLHERDYVYATPVFATDIENRREVIDWQTTWDPSDRLEIIGGINAEDSTYDINNARLNDDLRAAYVSAFSRPIRPLTVHGGLRYDDFETAGSATTWRGGASWTFKATGTKLRATYGTGFSAPGSDDRFGVAAYNQLPSPALRAEKSRGWDAGVDQSFFDKRLKLGATYFHNRFRDLFEYNIVDFTSFAGQIVNRARASTRGVELSAEATLPADVTAYVTYTYLDARNDITRARLTRRPRHTANLDLRWRATSDWIIGAGYRLVSGRIDGASAMEAYNTVRIYTSYAVTKDLTLKLRGENILDEDYSEVRGYPALPARAVGSVEWRF